jgi:hypothetical protein
MTARFFKVINDGVPENFGEFLGSCSPHTADLNIICRDVGHFRLGGEKRANQQRRNKMTAFPIGLPRFHPNELDFILLFQLVQR